MLLKLLLSDVEYILFVWILTQLVDFYMELKFHFEYLYILYRTLGQDMGILG